MYSYRNNQGIILALLRRFESQRLPTVLRMREKVDRGAKLSDGDIRFLDGVMADWPQVQRLAAKDPSYQKVVVRAIALYSHIARKALENEGAG